MSDENAGSTATREGADVPTRLCPHCAALSHGEGDFCPYCGGRFSEPRRGSRVSTRVKIAGALVIALLVLGGAGVAVAIKLHHDDQVAALHKQQQQEQLRRQQQLQQQQRRRQQEQQQQQQQRQAEISSRQSLESQLQNAVTKDATSKANDGTLTNGPAQSTTCTPVSGGSSQNLSQSSGTYSCTAVYSTNSDGTQTGYRYTGTINFDTGEMTWQLGGGGLGG